jgi:diguanylate cyclase (GGDEF)-like protein
MVGSTPTQAWGYSPSRPFVLLTAYYAVGAVQLAAVAVRPPFADTHVEALWALAGLQGALAVATLVAWAVSRSAVLPFLVAIGVLVAAVSTYVAVGGQGQLVAGFYLAALGVYAGYFLSVAAARGLALLATVSYGAALIANWKLDSPAYLLAMVVLVVGVTVIVSSLVQSLRAESIRDPLTGALNRRGLHAAAELVHGIDARRVSPTAIIEIDLDGFKAYNDTFGHHAGDQLLASVVADWSRLLRRTDVLARTGGDEFVVVLPATGRSEAEVLVARMREANDVPWTAGVVVWEPGEPLPQALRHADEAMYRHKPTTRRTPAREGQAQRSQ